MIIGDGRGLERYGIRPHDGFSGIFTTDECPRAKYKNGSLVRKDKSKPGDTVPNGSVGRVLGSIWVDDRTILRDDVVMYFVEWRLFPKRAIAIIEPKLTKA